MRTFSMGQAWSHGFRFFAGRWGAHAIALAGLGLLLPLALEYAVAGGELSTRSIAGLGLDGLGDGAAAVAVLLAGYLLQTASYFASWRLGQRGDATLGGAILYGLLAALLAIVLLALIGVLASFVARTFWTSSVAFLAILLFLLPLLVAAALFYTLPTVLLAAIVSLGLALAMIFGSVTGQMGMAATMTGGSGGVTVLLLVLGMVTIWIAARLSCATVWMAERRSLNPVAAVRESWRLTLDEQWAITRYLALIGFGFALLLAALAVAVGYGANAWALGAAVDQWGPAGTLIRLGIGIPFAFLTVMVPAGIYREAGKSDLAAAEVFA